MNGLGLSIHFCSRRNLIKQKVLLRLRKENQGLHLGWLTANQGHGYGCSPTWLLCKVCNYPPVCQRQGKKISSCRCLASPFKKDLLDVSSYRCIELTSEVRFINKNEIRKYILGPLHAGTCLMLSKKRWQAKNLQINWGLGEDIKGDW